MASQIIFFKKNKADFEMDYVTATASEGNDTSRNVLNRSNKSAWATSGSVDASNTTLEIDMVDVRLIDSILLMKHNFKSFKIEYWNDDTLAYQTFPTPIDQTTNTSESSYFSVSPTYTSKLRLTVRGTMVANADKHLFQFIMTEKIGQLAGWPIIKKPLIGRDIKKRKMLSGKMHVVENVGFYQCRLSVAHWKSSEDLAIVEALYDQSEGFLFWPCGGDEAQFSSVRQGYRFEDIYLVRCLNEYSPEWDGGLYKNGLKIDIDLAEVVT